MRGKNKISKRIKRRQQNVIDHKMLALREQREIVRQQVKNGMGGGNSAVPSSSAPLALQRFVSGIKYK